MGLRVCSSLTRMLSFACSQCSGQHVSSPQTWATRTAPDYEILLFKESQERNDFIFTSYTLSPTTDLIRIRVAYVLGDITTCQTVSDGVAIQCSKETQFPLNF